MAENPAFEHDDALATVAVRGHRRGRRWSQVTYAVHRPAEARCPPLAHPPHWSESDLAGWQLLMTSDGCFTALTALEIWGVDMPPLPEGCPVFIALGKNDPRPMRRGVHTSRHIRPVEHVVIRGLRVATVAEALVASARWLSQLDLVILIDSALHLRLVELSELVAISRTRRPGARALRNALHLVDGDAESLPESLLRLLHVACGVDVETQWVAFDANGAEIARVDLWLRGTTFVHEYDGDEHEKAPRRVSDLRRNRRLDRAGLTRRGYTLGDLLLRAVTVLEDIDRALGRPHDPVRIRVWTELVRHSVYSSAGQAALLERIPACPPRRRGDCA